MSNRKLLDKKIKSSLNLIEIVEISFFRFLDVKRARASSFSFNVTNSSFAKINVSSVWISTTSKWMNSMCSKQESNVDSIIDSLFLWCFWYVLNQCVSVSSTSYRSLTTRRIEFFNKLSSKNERMKNCLLKRIFDCTYVWVIFLKYRWQSEMHAVKARIIRWLILWIVDDWVSINVLSWSL